MITSNQMQAILQALTGPEKHLVTRRAESGRAATPALASRIVAPHNAELIREAEESD